MSMMGELKFFLGIQIHQSTNGIFINQAKYAQEILKKHGMTSCDSIGTPMDTKPLDADLSGTPVDQLKYHSMVGAIMYLTSSRPDIVHATCYCARYQARPTENHLKEVKHIFRYLKNTINMGLLYPKDTSFKLTAFSNSDHAGCFDTRKSTSGAEAEYVSLSAGCAQVFWMAFTLTKCICIAIQRHPYPSRAIQSSTLARSTLMSDVTLSRNRLKRFLYLISRLGMRCLTSAKLEFLENVTA
ncbi:retrovirus-related pol polyprotein from transposon TNT 1-94 [Tanacetum coccineum]|uniref:Retrovirus-related pol polyprotein from transposon TNT 1-94 n=1 Tax=Tanacetum coccineum TaxID=301880 RepID=A0ABQ5FH80_9ASTR